MGGGCARIPPRAAVLASLGQARAGVGTVCGQDVGVREKAWFGVRDQVTGPFLTAPCPAGCCLDGPSFVRFYWGSSQPGAPALTPLPNRQPSSCGSCSWEARLLFLPGPLGPGNLSWLSPQEGGSEGSWEGVMSCTDARWCVRHTQTGRHRPAGLESQGRGGQGLAVSHTDCGTARRTARGTARRTARRTARGGRQGLSGEWVVVIPWWV